MRITIKNLEIFISPEELKTLQNEKHEKAYKEAEKEIGKEVKEENKKTDKEIKNTKIGF